MYHLMLSPSADLEEEPYINKVDTGLVHQAAGVLL